MEKHSGHPIRGESYSSHEISKKDPPERAQIIEQKINADQMACDDMENSEFITLIPGKDEEEIEDATLNIREDSFSLASTFLCAFDGVFDMACENIVDYDEWTFILQLWEKFIRADDYDAILEELSGLNYDNWTAQNEFLMEKFSEDGASYWDNRFRSAELLNDLMIWTEKYKESCDYILIDMP